MSFALPTAIDVRLFEACHGSAKGGAFTWAMVGLTLLGSGWTMLALLPMLAAKRTRLVALALGAVWVVAAIGVFVTKEVVRRARPCTAFGFDALWGTTPTDYSFPSGHATGAFAFAAFVAVVGLAGAEGRREAAPWIMAGSAFLLAVGIALSRVYLGVHFPSDVMAGAALGSLIGAAGGIVYRRTTYQHRSTRDRTWRACAGEERHVP